jgi:hypothetical protein
MIFVDFFFLIFVKKILVDFVAQGDSVCWVFGA